VLIDGVTVTVKVAHMRLCHSRMPFVRAYPRETQEMVFDAHDRAFAFYKGACTRGIYDNMKTAVDAIFVGKERAYNRRFQQMCSHYLVDPVACTPASGWEKGQVENQVGTIRERLFSPRVRVRSMEELNDWLIDQCVARAKVQPHPEIGGKTIWEVFEDERTSLVPYRGRFDGFHAVQASVSKTCLVRFDNNKYSVQASAVGRPVEVRAYADRIELRQDGRVAASMPAPSAGAGPSTTPGTTSRCWPASPAPCATARRSSTGCCRPPSSGCASQAARRAGRRPADGGDPRRRADRRAARGRGRLRRGAERGRPFRRRDPEHPGPAPRSGPAGHDHDARGAAAGLRAGRRLHPVRQPEEGNLMERSQVLEAMGELKLFGMRGAYDEIVATAVKRQHEPRAG
jgi:hypothetical protein